MTAYQYRPELSTLHVRDRHKRNAGHLATPDNTELGLIRRLGEKENTTLFYGERIGAKVRKHTTQERTRGSSMWLENREGTVRKEVEDEGWKVSKSHHRTWIPGSGCDFLKILFTDLIE